MFVYKLHSISHQSIGSIAIEIYRIKSKNLKAKLPSIRTKGSNMYRILRMSYRNIESIVTSIDIERVSYRSIEIDT